MTNTALLQVDLQELMEKRSEVERRIQSAQGSLSGGLIGILLGLILLFLFWPLGVFLLIAGGLAAATQATKKGLATSEKTELDQQIAKLRRKIAGEPDEDETAEPVLGDE